MPTQSRIQSAQNYRVKSDESFAAANLCLQSGHYRAACNRAWYSIYQVVSAGVLARLNQSPPIDREAFNHAKIDTLLSHFLRAAHLRLRYAHLLDLLPAVRSRRVLGDYAADDQSLTADDARNAINAAARIRAVIYKVLEWPLDAPARVLPPLH